jgi:hypothetical protein
MHTSLSPGGASYPEESWKGSAPQPLRRARSASVTGSSDEVASESRQWNKYPRKIPAITQKYYVEGAAEGRAGGDNIGVGWARPGESTSAPSEVIPASVLSPFSGGRQ